MKSFRLAIGCDHAGFSTKQVLMDMLSEMGHEIKDFGAYSEDSVDYPDHAHPVSNAVAEEGYDLGILLCGSGNGINMTANKHKDIRSALCWKAEIAEMARLHNDANIIALPARYISEEEAKEIVRVFLNTDFEGGRHSRRVDKISKGVAC